MSKQEELFNEFMGIKSKVQSVASIVQNPMNIPLGELNEWTTEVNNIIKDLYDLKLEVNDYYMKEINK